MKGKTLLVILGLLALAMPALAVSVSSRQAAVAASAWASSGTALGMRLGTTVASVTSHSVTNGFAFYAVKLQGGGTVFMSSDTSFDPVLAFSSSNEPDLSVKGPLYALLAGDIAYRAQFAASANAGGGSSTMTTATSAANPQANSLWTRLLSAERPESVLSAKTSASSLTSVSVDPVTSVDDVRVAPLVSTKWSQDTVGFGRPCYNYYTPNGYACGCTATAMSQIMRYHEFPKDEIVPRTFACTARDLPETTGSYSTNLTTIAGTYDWSKMVNEPGDLTEGTYLEAIGHLTYDVGVSLKSEYTWNAGTTADPTDVPAALRDYFGYANGNVFLCSTWYQKIGGLHNLSTRQKVIYANLDAKLPVQLGIYGYDRATGTQWGGHAVVADGYGFKTIDEVKTAFVHVNLGWAGYDDLWYNLPEIHTGTGIVPGGSAYDFDYLGTAIFNIMPEQTGEILSGRVVDIDTNAVAGATVTAICGDEEKTTVTDSRGIYAFALPGNATYRLVAVSADGRKVVERETPVTLGSTIADSSYLVSSESAVGNRWGNDIVMAPTTIRIGTKEFVTLDTALAAAKELGGNPLLEVFAPTELKGALTNDFNCTIVSLVDDPATVSILVADGAGLTVGAGATLTVSNVVFESDAETRLAAVAGGKLRLGGKVGVERVVTDDADGLEIFAPLATDGILVDCAAARLNGQPFASASGDFAAVSNTVAQLLNPVDEDLCGLARESDRAVVWYRGECDPAVAEAAVHREGAVAYYRRLGSVLADLGGEPMEIEVLKNCTLSNAVTVVTNLILRAADDVAIALGPNAGFTATGGTLSVSGLKFSDYNGAGMFIVKGGKLELKDCAFNGIHGTGDYSGAVQVLNGLAAISDCSFNDCKLREGHQNYGGAVYLSGANCVVQLKNTTITNCYATTAGAGVYAYGGARVELSGTMVIKDNYVGSKTLSNLYLAKRAVLDVSGEMFGAKTVGVRAYGCLTNGAVFASISAPLTQEGVNHTLAALANDANAELVAVDPDGDAGERIAWGEVVDDPRVPSAAEAVVKLSGSGHDGWYATLEDAFEVIARDASDGAQLDLIRNASLGSGVNLTNRVTLGCHGSECFTVTRIAKCSVVIADAGDLTLTNVVFKGAADGSASAYGAFFYVSGGKLKLQHGTTLANAFGGEWRAESAVMVQGGSFTMENGSRLENSHNALISKSDGNGRGGALLADHASVYLHGGVITGSSSYLYGGGAYIGNLSHLYISGDMVINGNETYDGENSNLTISENCDLVLDAPLTGSIGYCRGPSVDKNIFGSTPPELWTGATGFTALTNSAANFHNDATRAYGVAVSNTVGELLLVWSRSICSDGSFTNVTAQGTEVYHVLGNIPTNEIQVSPTPIAFKSISVDSSAGTCTVVFTNLVTGCWYSLYSTNSLVGGFEIEGVQPLLKFQAETDGECEKTFPAAGNNFWRALGEDGVIYP